MLCAEDAACLLVEIGAADYRLEYYFLLHSAFSSPATPPGLFFRTLKDFIVWDA